LVSDIEGRTYINSVLRRMVQLQRDEIISGWRKLHNEELHDLYSSPDIITTSNVRRMRWEGRVNEECT
jgi:hypothetical protein